MRIQRPGNLLRVKWKEKYGLADPEWNALDLLTENVVREVEEEAKIRKFEGLRYTGLVLQGVEKASSSKYILSIPRISSSCFTIGDSKCAWGV
jgi:hypothetical protein